MPANGRQLCRCPGRAPGQNVGASQRRHKALPVMGRQLGRCPAAFQGKMLAPRNGGIRFCRQTGANFAGFRLRFPIFRPGVDARPVPTWCTNPRSPVFFRSLCTKSPDLFGARPARTWCTNPRKTLFFRPLCTKSPGLFSARPARTWCTNPRKTLFFRSLCTKSPDLFGARPARAWCTNPRKTLFFRPLCTKSPDLFGYRPALGGKFPAGALKAEKENGRGHSPFPLSLNRKLPAGRRKLTNCYSYAVYRSSRYLYRSSASFMYCDAPENIFDKLNR